MKPTLKKIDGILLLDKPLNISSNGALQRIKRLFGAKKAGHTGSLDPLATGMLPICFGEATKISQFLLESDKHYQVNMKLGIKTTTGDAEGEVIQTKSADMITREQVHQVMQQFLGQIQQIPPMYSALKHQGKPLYELARQGLDIPRKARAVKIHTLQLTNYVDDVVTFDVHCSKGTYVRTLVEDIGDQLGCGAYVSALRRTAVTPYEQNKMYSLSLLEEMHAQSGLAALMQCLLPIDTSVQHLPVIKLSSSATFYIRTGQSVMTPNLAKNGWVRIYSDNSKFMGIGEILDDGRLVPRRLLAYLLPLHAPSSAVSCEVGS